MTVLQSAWAHFVENGRFAQALLLLHENVTRVSEADFPELSELLTLTAELERAA
jgi:hypothetical protein